MGSPYQSQSASNYNASPPADDGSTVAANKITWAGIKTKLADSIKGLADAMNTALRAALNVTPSTTSVNYTTLVGDHLTTIECTGTITISLGDAATMIAQTMGYTVTVYNKGTNTVTVALATNTNKLNGQTNGNITLPPLTAGKFTVAQSGTDYEMIATSNPQTLNPPRSYLAGLTMSTAGASTTMTTAAGQAVDSTNLIMLTLGSSIGKTTSAWAVGTGNGGIDTGAVANSTWYHWYLIMRPDTGVVDAIFSLNASAPTLPTSYTYFRRIGSGKTNGSGQWTSFTQDGDYFRWAASVLDVNANNPGAAAVTSTLTVPTGVNVHALLNANLTSTNLQNVLYLSDLAANDEVAAAGAAPIGQIQIPNIAGAWNMGWGGTIRTNTSAQIRRRCNASDANTTVYIATLGWVDTRGRNS